MKGRPLTDDITRFRVWWETQRDLETMTHRAIARLAWQESTKLMTCGHPAACGEPCGWCAAVKRVEVLEREYLYVMTAYSDSFPGWAFASVHSAVATMAAEIASLRGRLSIHVPDEQQEPRP